MGSENEIREALRGVKYPGFSRDIVSFDLVKDISLKGKEARIRIEIVTSDPSIAERIKEDAQAAVKTLPGVDSVTIDMSTTTPSSTASQMDAPTQTPIEGVRHVIAVASGKGGVGKSTVAANLAVAFGQQGWATGLCDCDMYGPSIGMMFGVNTRPSVSSDEKILPVERFGVKLMSMSFLIDAQAPVILRGPMVTRFTRQFLRDVDWGKLDVLLLDLPPGTGDIQLTIVQTIALSGAVIVTTPQEVALADARKAISMFRKVNVPIVGIVENMSYFICPSNGCQHPIFGAGGGAREAKTQKVPLLAEVPIEIDAREAGDQGHPIVGFQPESKSALAFQMAARRIVEWLG